MRQSSVKNQSFDGWSQNSVEPNFFIVGAPRCGTTAMSAYLTDHAEICFSNPKEPHFFCTDMPAMRYVKSNEDYLACFAHGSQQRPKAVGEGSVWYLYSPAAIDKILLRYPHARFLIMVRNPLELVPSFHQKNIESLDEEVRGFEQAWELQTSRRDGKNIPARCRDKRLLDYVWVGKLGAQVQRIYKQVDPGQRQVIVYDDLASDPLSVYLRVLEFLGVDYDGREDFPRINANRRTRSQTLLALAKNPPASLVDIVSAGKRVLGVDRLGVLPALRAKLLTNTTREALSDVLRESMLTEYSSDIDLLSDIIQRDLSHWKY